MKWVGVSSGSTAEAVFVTAKDVNGKPIEGLKVDVAWPTATGTRHEIPVHRRERPARSGYGPVGTSPEAVRPTIVTATTTVRGPGQDGQRVVGDHAPIALGRQAGSGRVVSDKTVVPGQVVTVTSVAHDTKGRPVPNLLVTWTWNYDGKRVHTHGHHGRQRARDEHPADHHGDDEEDDHVTAHTQSASRNRYVYHELQAPSSPRRRRPGRG